MARKPRVRARAQKGGSFPEQLVKKATEALGNNGKELVKKATEAATKAASAFTSAASTSAPASAASTSAPAPAASTSAPASAATGAGAGDDPKGAKKGTVKELFMTLYGLLMIIMIAIFIFLFLTSVFDIFQFAYREASQARQLSVDSRVFIDETNDYDIVRYPVTTSTNEPYSVYTQQKMITYIFSILALFIIVVGGQLFMHLLMYCLDKLGKIEYDETAGFDDPKFYVIGGVITLITIACFSINALYKHYFIKKVEPNMLHIRSHMQKVRSHFIDNTPASDDPFWVALKNGDNEAIIQDLAESLGKVQITPHTTSTSIGNDPNAIKVMKILYACNVYNNLVNTIPESDPMWYRFDNLFSKERHHEDSDINLLFYYNNIPIIDSGAYAIFKGMDLETVFNAHTTSQTTKLSDIENVLQMNSMPLITELNNLLNNMRNIKDNKGMFASYIYGLFVIALFFIAILFGSAGYIAMNLPKEDRSAMLNFNIFKKEKSKTEDSNSPPILGTFMDYFKRKIPDTPSTTQASTPSLPVPAPAGILGSLLPQSITSAPSKPQVQAPAPASNSIVEALEQFYTPEQIKGFNPLALPTILQQAKESLADKTKLSIAPTPSPSLSAPSWLTNLFTSAAARNRGVSKAIGKYALANPRPAAAQR